MLHVQWWIWVRIIVFNWIFQLIKFNWFLADFAWFKKCDFFNDILKFNMIVLRITNENIVKMNINGLLKRYLGCESTRVYIRPLGANQDETVRFLDELNDCWIWCATVKEAYKLVQWFINACFTWYHRYKW